MKKLCIFDLDGTVLDTVGSIAHFGNLALAKNGLAPIEPDEYRYLAGDGARTLVHRMLSRLDADDEETFTRVFCDYNAAYNASPTYLTEIFPGLRETLDRIRAHGVSLAIVSNKPDFAAKAVTEALWGKDYFAPIVGQREGIALKPDPTAVLDVVKSFDLTPADCIYVGDTSTDMHTGKNAGILTVGVLWGFRAREELLATGADVVISRPEELEEIVGEEAGRRIKE